MIPWQSADRPPPADEPVLVYGWDVAPSFGPMEVHGPQPQSIGIDSHTGRDWEEWDIVTHWCHLDDLDRPEGD